MRHWGYCAALLDGMAGDALDEVPITNFGLKMKEAISLLKSGILPDSLCDELRKRWSIE